MTLWIWQHQDWPMFVWRESELSPLIAEARLWQGKLLGATQLLDTGLSLEAQAEIIIEDGINTSAIEGEKIDLDAIRSSVARHLGLPTQLPEPPRHIDGLVEVLLDATTHYATTLSIERLCGWQAALFPTGYSGLYKIITGALRSGDNPMQVVSGPIGKERVHFEAPSSARVPRELAQFIDWFNSEKPGLDGLLRAGIAHLWFITIHPFEDGNGRLARAITDMAIAQDEKCAIRLFSLSTQIMKMRTSYYDLLEATQRNSLDITEWLKWFLKQVIEACQSAQQTINRVLTKARFWIKFNNIAFTVRQRKIMNRLLDIGAGEFIGGMNTRKYVSLTKASRATAYRELNELVEYGCLIRVGSGRSVAYFLAVF